MFVFLDFVNGGYGQKWHRKPWSSNRPQNCPVMSFAKNHGFLQEYFPNLSKFNVWPPWRKQLPCDGWGKPMVLQVHREHIRSIGTYQIHWFTTCLHRIIQDRFATGLPLGVVLCWFPSIYLLIQVCVASMFLPFHIGIGSLSALSCWLGSMVVRLSVLIICFSSCLKHVFLYVCFSSCHIIETFPIWYVMISCRLDIISFGNPDIASHTMCLWAERCCFFCEKPTVVILITVLSEYLNSNPLGTGF